CRRYLRLSHTNWKLGGIFRDLIERRLMLRTNRCFPFLIAAIVTSYSPVAFANDPRNAEWG
ncbi:MAG: hypothetical protein MK102_18540, partial [Fuerstiella sp.]|nr:hypothetical protein [Fuerstiella sp.]